jgi:3-isopropylmalate/(R)-2-methylmalate dehydratase large subunit
MIAPRTMFAKIWDDHVITARGADEALLHVDLNLLHEGSFHSFTELVNAGRAIRRPDQTFAVADHYVPTVARERGLAAIRDHEIRGMVEILASNARAHGITHFGMDDPRQGIVHVIGPELGLTQPGLTITCPDSHTATHGALGAFAFGIGASQVTQVLATQCLWQKKPRTLRIEVLSRIPPGVSAKDLILAIIAKIGIAGARGHVVEYAGSAIRALSMEGRMTVCNMSIEAGGRAGMIAPDDTTFEYLAGREYAPRGADWERAVAWWRALPSDEGAVFDQHVELSAGDLQPMVTWGTTPEEAVPVTACVPDVSTFEGNRRAQGLQALAYMNLAPGTRITDIAIDRAFIGTCTNGRLEDLRAAAVVLKGRKAVVPAWVAPGSTAIKRAAESEGLDRIFMEAGFEWRASGCSSCAGHNGDTMPAGARVASTSNRNFENRQGKGARTHLMSPAMVAAAAVTGKITDVRQLLS